MANAVPVHSKKQPVAPAPEVKAEVAPEVAPEVASEVDPRGVKLDSHDAYRVDN